MAETNKYDINIPSWPIMVLIIFCVGDPDLIDVMIELIQAAAAYIASR